MTVAEARSRCADLVVLAWDEPSIAAELVRASAAFLIASPQVTPVAGAPGMWWIGAGGMEGIGGERALVQTLLRVARRWHPESRVAVASSCVAARAGVWENERRHDASAGQSALPAACVIVPRGRDAEYLAAAPLSLIPMDPDVRASLIALGLRTAGALAALSPEDVERRWGADGLSAWRLSHGDDPRRPVLARVDSARCVTTELAMPVTSVEPILFLLRAALERLTGELVRDGRAAATLAITLTLDDGRGALPSGGLAHTITREVRLARPVARVLPLVERCRALLEKWTLDAPVCGVTLAVTATAPLAGEQGNLLDTSWRDPDAVDAALARLRAELGPNAVVRAVACDSHRPERAGAWIEIGDEKPTSAGAPIIETPVIETPVIETPVVGVQEGTPTGPWVPAFAGTTGNRAQTPTSAPPANSSASSASSVSSASEAFYENEVRRLSLVREPAPTRSTQRIVTAAALRLLEEPQLAEVECDGETPVLVWWRGRRIPILRAIGPERLSGDWWTDPFRRDYWRCESENGELLVFAERETASAATARASRPSVQWKVHGWYD